MRNAVVVLVVLLLAALGYALAVGSIGAVFSRKAGRDTAAGAPDQFHRPDRTKP